MRGRGRRGGGGRRRGAAPRAARGALGGLVRRGGGTDARRGARYVRGRPRPADDAPEFPLTRRTDVIARRLDAKTTTTDCRAVDGAEVSRAFAAALDAVGLGGLGAARVRVARHFAQAGVSAGERARVTVLFLSWSFEAAPQLGSAGSALGRTSAAPSHHQPALPAGGAAALAACHGHGWLRFLWTHLKVMKI